MAAAESGEGGYAGAFLKLSIAPRAAAMGGAYLGLSDDAAGQLYNPAGITAVGKKVFSSSYRSMDFGRKLGYVSFMLPTRMESALGISWHYAGYGEVATRNSSGQDLGTTISSNEHVFGLVFAKQFTPLLGAGAKLNYYLKKLSDLDASSVGINLGVMFSIDSLFEYGSMEEKKINDIKAGIVIDNLAARYTWNAAESGLRAAPDDEFPVVIGLGVSFRSFDRQLLVAADFEKIVDRFGYFRVGAEYVIMNVLALRAGMDDGVLTAGMGYRLNLGQAKLSFDYAFSDSRVGESSDHIFGLHYNF